MKSRRQQKLVDFISYNGEYSHTRLIAVASAGVVLVVFVLNPLNEGIQSLVQYVILGAIGGATISKFSKNPSQPNDEEYGDESASPQEIWSPEPEQPEPCSVGRSKRTRNRRNS